MLLSSCGQIDNEVCGGSCRLGIKSEAVHNPKGGGHELSHAQNRLGSRLAILRKVSEQNALCYSEQT